MQTWITKKATYKRFAALSQWDLPPGTIRSHWQFLFGLSLHLMCSTVLNKAFSHFWTSFIVWEHFRVLHACMVIVITLALVSAFLLCWTQHILHLGPSDSTNTARSACLMQFERFIYSLDTQIWEISLRQRCILTLCILESWLFIAAPYLLLIHCCWILVQCSVFWVLTNERDVLCFASSGC